MQYRLKQPWTLRGWKNMHCCLAQQERMVQRLTFDEFSLLYRCDGQTPLEAAADLDKWIKRGVIEASREPIAPEQAYELHEWVLRQRVQWAITGNCNYRCRHCFVAPDAAGTGGEFTLAQCQTLVRQLRECGVSELELTGGEPLMHPQFMDILELVTAEGLRVVRLLTNGALLTDAVLDAMAALDMHPCFAISFDGIGTHDWMRGQTGAEQAALDAMTRVHARGETLLAHVNLNRVTAPRLTETCRMLATRFHANLHIIRTGETPRWGASGSEPMTLGYDECYALELAVAKTALAEHWGVEIHGSNGFHLPSDGNMRQVVAYWDTPRTPQGGLFDACTACKRMFIAHDGRVLPCDAFGGTSAAAGHFMGDANVLQRPLREILTDSAYTRAFAYTMEDYIAANPACAACNWLHVCRGGCRAYAYGASMVFGKGYAAGEGSMLNKAMTTCTFFSGGYADRLRKLCEK